MQHAHGKFQINWALVRSLKIEGDEDNDDVPLPSVLTQLFEHSL
jgi:hypothetical protein